MIQNIHIKMSLETSKLQWSAYYAIGSAVCPFLTDIGFDEEQHCLIIIIIRAHDPPGYVQGFKGTCT